MAPRSKVSYILKITLLFCLWHENVILYDFLSSIEPFSSFSNPFHTPNEGIWLESGNIVKWTHARRNHGPALKTYNLCLIAKDQKEFLRA